MIAPASVGAEVVATTRPTGSWVTRALLGLVAAALVAAALWLPLWQAHLVAPQYPDGLELVAFGDRVEGDIAEVTSLNHYVGMRPFAAEDLPELGWWPLVVATAVVAVVVSALAGRRLAGRFARLYLWGVPIGVLLDVQLRLYQYGHDLDPDAALRIPPFTPLVVGPTKVWNFTTWSRPGIGVLGLFAAALLLSVGARLGRGRGRARTARAVAGALALLLTLPGVASAGEHDHHRGGDAPAVDDLAQRLAQAAPGELIDLGDGRYTGDLVIEVPVVLQGEGAWIVGSGEGTTLTIRAPGTVVRGVHVHGSGPGPTGSPAGIRVEADDVTIERTVVHDAYTGIAVVDARGVRLIDNTILGRADAPLSGEGHAAVTEDAAPAAGADPHAQHAAPVVQVASRGRGDAISLNAARDVLVRGNEVEDARDGIYLSFTRNVLLDRNVVRRSRYAVHAMYAQGLVAAENTFEANLSAMVLMYGGDLLALRNVAMGNLSPSTGFGLLLKDVVGVQAVENVLVGNRVGIHIDGPTGGSADGVQVRGNTIARNTAGIALLPTAQATFAANNVVANVIQVQALGTGAAAKSVWADNGVGNHWSTYRGYGGPSGVGVVPHEEGGVATQAVTRSPALAAIATSPGGRLLAALEDRWGRREPLLIDELPLTRPVLRARMPGGATPARGLAMVVGLLLLVPSSTVARTRRRGSVPHPRLEVVRAGA